MKHILRITAGTLILCGLNWSIKYYGKEIPLEMILSNMLFLFGLHMLKDIE